MGVVPHVRAVVDIFLGVEDEGLFNGRGGWMTNNKIITFYRKELF